MNFWGEKTTSLLDVWTVEHFISGIALMGVVYYLCHRFLPEIFKSEHVPKKKKDFLLCLILLAIALYWESFEFYMEAGYSPYHDVTYWFHGVEHWSNRLVSDPLITVMGGYVGLRYIRWTLAARLVSCSWLALHIFVFPHSMYLHEIM